jgi:hypothetical protein
MDDLEGYNNATLYLCAKTTTCSGGLDFGPRDGGIIMQQSRTPYRLARIASRSSNGRMMQAAFHRTLNEASFRASRSAAWTRGSVAADRSPSIV